MIEFLSSHLWQMWSLLAILALILELTSGDFFILCFAIGAAGAAVVSPFSSFMVQLVVFAIATILCLIYVRPFALRYLHKKSDERLSNADAIIGQRGIVSQTIKAGGYGRVALGGDDWKAMSQTNIDIPEGTAVVVTDRQSVIITVKVVDTEVNS